MHVLILEAFALQGEGYAHTLHNSFPFLRTPNSVGAGP